MLSRKAKQRFFLVAMVSSIPLALLIAFYGTSASFLVNLLLFLAPVFIGIIAVVWLLVLLRLLPRLWAFSAPVSGAAVGVLAFQTYAVLVAIGAKFTTSTSWTEALLAIGVYGMLLYGWIPLVCGAFAGWIAERTDARPVEK